MLLLLLLLLSLLPQRQRVNLVDAKAATSYASCTGPRTSGELKEMLWGSGSAGYDPYTRPGVAKAAAEASDKVDSTPTIAPTVSETFSSAPTTAANGNATTGNGNDNGNATYFELPPPDIVRVQWHVLSLTSLNQKQNEFQLNVWFRRRWNDYRLQYASASHGGCFDDADRQGFDTSILDNREIWSPDLFVENQAAGTTTTVADSVWIYPSGDVVHVTAMVISLACAMDFDNFPNDVQRCGIRVGTWLEDARAVQLDFWQNLSPVTLASNVTSTSGQLPQGGTNEWKIIDARPIYQEAADKGHGATQAESYADVQLVLERVADYYLDFVIAPAVMFVIIGWCSFFVSRQAAPARVTMTIVCFLANSNFLASQLNQLPRLGNDVWLLRFLSMSSMFSFYAVLEYVLCNYLCRLESRIEGAQKRAQELLEQKQYQRQEQGSGGSGAEQARSFSTRTNGIVVEPVVVVTKQDLQASGFDKRMDLLLVKANGEMIFRDQHVDIFSRYFYPLAYAVMCVVLWVQY